MVYSSGNLTPKKQSELLEKLEDHFLSNLDHPTWVEWRKNAVLCFKYKEGDQWSAEEKKVLRERHQPETVNNQISVTINRMVGQFVKQRTRIGYRGRNPDDKPAAEVLTDLHLFIRQNNALEFEEREMADDGFTSGFGVLEAYVSFDDLYQPEIKLRFEDPFNIFVDPHSRRYDWNEDASYICRAKWLDVDEAVELYPDHAKKLKGLVSSAATNVDWSQTSQVASFKKENYVDDKTQRIRIVEDWYKVRERQEICLFNDGSSVDKTRMVFVSRDGQERPVTKEQIEKLKAAQPDYQEINRIKHKMYCGVFTCGLLLEHREVDRQYFPFIPYFVHRKKSGEPYSLIFIAMSMQDAINKRESKAVHLLNTNLTVTEQGAITDLNAHAEEKAKPDGIVEINRGFFDKFLLHNNLELAQSQFAMHGEAKNDFRRITGINPDALGERSEVRSGVGIARKQAMTDVIIAPIFDNFRRTRVIEAKVVLELIQKYYTEPKVFYITDNLNAAQVVNLDANSIGAIKQGSYDVVVDDLPDTTTIQEEQFQMLATVLPQMLPFGPFWTRIMIQASEIRNKDEIIKQIEQMSQPPPTEPKIAYSADMTGLLPLERAALWNKMGMPEVAEAVLQSAPPPADQAKAQADMAKEGVKAAAAERKAEMDKEKMQMDVQMKGVDLMVKTELGKLDIIKKQMEIQKSLIDASNPNGGGGGEGGAQGNSD